MKILKFPLFLLAIGFAVMSAFAFNNAPVKKTGLQTNYHYIGAYTDVEVVKPENWETSGPACQNSGSLPCIMAGSDDRPTFDAVVENLGTIDNAQSLCQVKTFQ